MIATLATKQKSLKKRLVHTVGGFLRAHPHTNSERASERARRRSSSREDGRRRRICLSVRRGRSSFGAIWGLVEAAEGEESAGRKLSFRKDLGDLRWEAEEAGKREGGLEVDPKKSKF